MELLWDISKNDLYECFVNIKKGNRSEIVRLYNQILFSVQDLRFVEKNSKVIMNDLISALKDFNQQFNISQRELMGLRDKYYHEIHSSGNVGAPTFFTGSEKILKTWTSQENHRKQHMVYEYLAKPLKAFCEQYPSEPYSVEYIKQAALMITLQNNMVIFKKDYSNTYKSYSKDLEKDVKAISEAIMKLNVFQDKWWF